MPTLSNGSEVLKVKPYTPLIEVSEKLGVPFSCSEGKCGTCLIEVVSGMENLSVKTDAEKEFGLEKNERLSCQTNIRTGDVVIEI